jgi:hypothetical protein
MESQDQTRTNATHDSSAYVECGELALVHFHTEGVITMEILLW